MAAARAGAAARRRALLARCPNAAPPRSPADSDPGTGLTAVPGFEVAGPLPTRGAGSEGGRGTIGRP